MNKTSDTKCLVAIDLFAGGGGLTAGLKGAGFKVCSAVEIDRTAVETYQCNHPETVVFSKDIRLVNGEELIATSPTNKVDMIAACPPCQSFSSLTSKYKKKDLRDELIFEFTRLVKEIMPRTIMMENVPGLAQKGKHLFAPAMKELEELGYELEFKVLEVADYGVPQRRKRLVVLGGLGKKISIPAPTHCETQDEGSDAQPWITVKDVLSDLPSPITLSRAKTLGGPQSVDWHVIRDMSLLNKARLESLQEGNDRTGIPTHLRPVCHAKDFGFTNVYGRMAWNKPSPTITGGCTTLSKGRFGHPSELRTISVREAARLQTFPDDYKISTDYMDKACLIIGNALPPLFAEKMARTCADSLAQG